MNKPSDTSRISDQLAFLTEADKLKTILRASPICDGSRRENSGEHSWHLALYAMILSEHAVRPVNVGRVIKMLLIHDLVEIDAGDHPLHGDGVPAEQVEAEKAAAERIFGLLPADQMQAFKTLWEEFEAAESDDAIFAKSIDRVQPVLANLETNGGTWSDYDVTLEKLEARVGVKVRKGAPAIWNAISDRIRDWFSNNENLRKPS
ncbi:HD domain-containing protein [Alphaproteobacteria bacterium]|nr:HD domain-containing protein [Alphaproteobacteria bacterium]